MKQSFIRLVSILLIYALFTSSLGIITGGTGILTANAAGRDVSVTSSTYNKVVHITWDGFYSELYDLAKKNGKATPHLDALVANGMRFMNHKTTVPSVEAAHYSATTGAYPKTTGNTYKYLNGNTVTGTGSTTNNAQTITSAMANTRNVLVVGEPPLRTGVTSPYTYNAATKFADGVSASVNSAVYQITTYGQPDYLNIYSNDIYNVGRSGTVTKEGLLNDQLDALVALDGQLGILKSTIDQKGDPQKTTYMISSHSGSVLTESAASKKTADLVTVMTNSNFKVKATSSGVVTADIDLVVVNNFEAKYLQIIFNKAITSDQVDALIQTIKSQPYVKDVLTRQQLDPMGVHPKFADLLVLPKDGFDFTPTSVVNVARPDAFDSTAMNVFGVISGNLISQKGIVRAQTSIIDIAPTISAIMGTPVPVNAEGRSLLNLQAEPPIDNYVLYINMDGFAYKWYELANRAPYGGTPNFNALIQDGVLFTNASTGIPSITNPMQQAIVSGAWPIDTGNDYRHYDNDANIVVQYDRDNALENVAEAVFKRNIKLAAVNAFFFENRGAVAGEEAHPYISAGSAQERADALIKVIKGEPVKSGNKMITFADVPNFLSLYFDSMDGAGHNTHDPIQGNLQDYLDTMAKTLIEVDEQIGRVVDTLKARGIYDKTTIALTTDHGMVRFGADTNEFQQPYLPGTLTSLPDLEQTIAAVGQKFRGKDYKVETVYAEGTSAKPDTEVVITTVGLQAQIKFRKPVESAVLDEIVARVKEKEYYGAHMYKEDIVKRGTAAHFADLLISPQQPYHFKTGDPTKLRPITGQHDSLEDDAQHVFALLAGANVKKGIVYNKKMYNIDLGPTMARLLGIEGPASATGIVLDEVLDEAYRGPILALSTPSSNDVYVNTSSFTVSGQTAPQATVKINDKAVGVADAQGAFSVAHTLVPGINRLIVETVAADNARETRQVVYVTYTVPREQLLQKLSEGKALYEAAVEGPDTGHYKPGSKAVFKESLTEAVILSENIDATQTLIANGLTKLAVAVVTFHEAERLPTSNYHIYGEIALNGKGKLGTTVSIYNALTNTTYQASYGEPQANTANGKYYVGDSVDIYGNVTADRVQYYFDMPKGEYTLTYTFGGTTLTRSVSTVSTTRGELPWGGYLMQNISETSATTGSSNSSGSSDSGGYYTGGPSTSGTNGSTGSTGSTSTGQPVHVTLDEKKLDELLNQLKNSGDNRIMLPIAGSEAGTTLEISGGSLSKVAAAPEAILTVQTELATYHLPVRLLQLSEWAQKLGTSVDQLKVTIKVEKASDELAQQMAVEARATGTAPLSEAIEFSITVEVAGGSTVEINSFGGTYVTRTVIIPGYIDPFRATAVWYDPATGELTFVPAVFSQANGKTEAAIKRSGNSAYMIISGQKSFDDLANHWAKSDIELLASKQLAKGVSERSFAPDSDITRAQFTALLVRALGLGEVKGGSAFVDVSQSDWHAGYVGAAVKAGIVSGMEDGSFRPDDAITREQMAVMIARALKAAGASASITVLPELLASKFSDQAQISAWAKESVTASVQAGIVIGMDDKTFGPSANASRAQAATMLKRFLQYAQFMN